MPTLGNHIVTFTSADVGNTFTDGLTVKSVKCIGTGATVAGHQFKLEDPNGNLLYRDQASGAWYVSESITQRHWFDGIKVIALDSGAIDVEFEFQSPIGFSKY